jgi:hypothetical protein
LRNWYVTLGSNKGASSVDGHDFADTDAYGVKRWLGDTPRQKVRQDQSRGRAIWRAGLRNVATSLRKRIMGWWVTLFYIVIGIMRPCCRVSMF